jgi:hypothetical protein
MQKQKLTIVYWGDKVKDLLSTIISDFNTAPIIIHSTYV